MHAPTGHPKEGRRGVELFPDVDGLDEHERRALLVWLRGELGQIEIQRRFLHERIDLLQAEVERRWCLRFEALGDGAVELSTASGPHVRPLFAGTGEVPDEPLGGLPDLATTSDPELHALLNALRSREDDVSLKRRELHVRIDMLGPPPGPSDEV
jgi:hypothetical protein